MVAGKYAWAEITGARYQIVDRYDWNKGVNAQIPVPKGQNLAGMPADAVVRSGIPFSNYELVQVKDDWFAQIGAAGLAKSFVVKSDIIDLGTTQNRAVLP